MDAGNSIAAGTQGVCERLSAPRENGLDDRGEDGRVSDRRVGRMKAQADERRKNLGRRPKCTRRQLQDQIDIGRMADQDAEHAVLPASRCSDEAVGDLALKHDRRVDQWNAGGVELHKREENRRRDVVGETAGDTDSRWSLVIRRWSFVIRLGNKKPRRYRSPGDAWPGHTRFHPSYQPVVKSSKCKVKSIELQLLTLNF